MGFLDDIFGTVDDWLSSASDRIPGGEWIRGGINDAVDALSGSKTGQTLLTVISASLVSGGFTALAPIVGPQAASAAFAIPGVVLYDDSFSRAWVDEFTTRLARLAHDYGPQAASDVSQQMVAASNNPDLKNISPESLADLERTAGTPNAGDAFRWANMSPENLAAKYGGRADVWAAFLNGKTRSDAFHLSGYDLRTGAPLPSQSRLGYLGGTDVDAPSSAPIKSLRHLGVGGDKGGLVFATSPAGAKKAREAGAVVAMLAPALLVLLFLKLPAMKKHRG